jgi:hypothetical protein
MEDGHVGLGQAAADPLSSAMLSSMWSIAVRPPRVTDPSWVKIPLVPSKPVRCPVVPSPASNSLFSTSITRFVNSVVTLARKASHSHEIPTCTAIFCTCTTCEVAGMVNSGLLAPSAVTAALPPTASAFSRTSSRRTSGVIMGRRSHAVGHVEHDAQLFGEFGPPVGHGPVQVETRAAHQRGDHAGDPLGLARDSRFVVVLNALWLSQ